MPRIVRFLKAVQGCDDLGTLTDGRHRLAAGSTLPAPVPVFPRYVEPVPSAAQ